MLIHGVMFSTQDVIHNPCVNPTRPQVCSTKIVIINRKELEMSSDFLDREVAEQLVPCLIA